MSSFGQHLTSKRKRNPAHLIWGLLIGVPLALAVMRFYGFSPYGVFVGLLVLSFFSLGSALGQGQFWGGLIRTTGFVAGRRGRMVGNTLASLAESAPYQASAPLGVNIRAEGQGEALTLVWTQAEGGAEVCPYCRDGLEAQSLLQARCGTCRTLHHEECLAELGRCSVYGCGGEQVERVERCVA